MSDYAEERLRTIRSRNEQNKRRSREMERKVATFLGGRRIPMSGAGAIKGDCDVITDRVGYVFIECKYSGRVHPSKGPLIILQLAWLIKMSKDAVSMRAKFPALVFRYHNVRFSDYVIIPLHIAEMYLEPDRVISAPVIDIIDKYTYTLFKNDLDILFSSTGYAALHTTHANYIIMTLHDFKDMIYGNTDSSGISNI